MAAPLRHAALALSLCAAGVAGASNWRALQTEAGPDKACVEVPESIDDFVASRARLLPLCRLNLDVAQLARGFVVLCGPERGYILFRRQRACVASLRAVRSQRILTPAEVAPEGTASPERWMDAMAVCLQGVTEEVVAARRVQAQVGACECVAAWAGAFAAGAELPRVQATWEGVVARCGEAEFGVPSPAGAVSELAAALVRALAPQPPPAAPPSVATPAGQPAAGATGPIRAGAPYAEVMAALRDHPVEKVPAGDVLTATYQAPALLAYPDAGGRCVLTFVKGRLDRCEGCDPARLPCDR